MRVMEREFGLGSWVGGGVIHWGRKVGKEGGVWVGAGSPVMIATEWNLVAAIVGSLPPLPMNQPRASEDLAAPQQGPVGLSE